MWRKSLPPTPFSAIEQLPPLCYGYRGNSSSGVRSVQAGQRSIRNRDREIYWDASADKTLIFRVYTYGIVGTCVCAFFPIFKEIVMSISNFLWLPPVHINTRKMMCVCHIFVTYWGVSTSLGVWWLRVRACRDWLGHRVRVRLYTPDGKYCLVET